MDPLDHSSLIARLLPSALGSGSTEISQHSRSKSWLCLQPLGLKWKHLEEKRVSAVKINEEETRTLVLTRNRVSMSNVSSLAPDTFILTGIPGMEQLHIWISVPFCCLHVAAVLANGALLLTVWAEPSLHQPMYLLLCLLALADLTLSTTAVPRALALFWFRAGDISFGACLTQMFFLHFTCLVESEILLAMAFDRFVAIRFPPCCGAVLSVRAVARAGLAAVLGGLCAILPCVLLLRRLRFCGPRAMAHTYCEHVAAARLACADIRAHAWYGLLPPFALGAWTCSSSPSPTPSSCRPKALHTCGSHLCVLLLFCGPAALAALAQRFGRGVRPDVHIVLANLSVLLPPLLNPVVYGVRTRQIRDRALKVLVGPRSRVLGPPASFKQNPKSATPVKYRTPDILTSLFP
ncbi:hypothetical protein IHE44_0004879, partial [Lamprotornis superbus]